MAWHYACLCVQLSAPLCKLSSEHIRVAQGAQQQCYTVQSILLAAVQCPAVPDCSACWSRLTMVDIWISTDPGVPPPPHHYCMKHITQGGWKIHLGKISWEKNKMYLHKHMPSYLRIFTKQSGQLWSLRWSPNFMSSTYSGLEPVKHRHSVLIES